MTVFCYQHHINDWRNDTGDLSLEQKGAYRELLDWYYATEGRLPSDIDKLCRMLGVQTQSERTATAEMVQRFFTDVDGLLTQKRAEKELKKLKDKSLKASQAAKIKHLASANAERTHSERTANQEPRTNNQEPVKNPPIVPQKITNPFFDELWEIWIPYDQDKGSKKKAMQSYNTARKSVSHETIIGGANKYLIFCHARGQRTKHVTTWINQNGWENEYPEPVSSPATSANGKPTYADSIKTAAQTACRVLQERESLREEDVF